MFGRGYGEFGQTSHFTLERAEALERGVVGGPLLRGDAACVGCHAVAEEEDYERGEFSADEEDEAEGEEFEEVVAGAVIEDEFATGDVGDGEGFVLVVGV